MKRDMDLVRAILIALEDHPHAHAPRKIDTGLAPDDETFRFHVHLMGEGGLLHVTPMTSMGSKSPEAWPVSITWAGYEFLDAARKDSTWNRAKGLIAKAGGASMPIWLEVLKKIALDQIGTP